MNHWHDLRDSSVLERFGFKPRTPNQQIVFDLIQDESKKIAVVCGPAGTGKTRIPVWHAVNLLRSNRIKQVLCVRPAEECGRTLGFRPGTDRENIESFIRPFIDKFRSFLNADEFNEYCSLERIVFQPLQTMRGDEWVDSIVILDEAQNATTAQMKMFLTRIGDRCRVVLAGDPEQIDIPGPSGLVHVLERIPRSGPVGFAFLTEDDIQRPEIVKFVLRHW